MANILHLSNSGKIQSEALVNLLTATATGQQAQIGPLIMPSGAGVGTDTGVALTISSLTGTGATTVATMGFSTVATTINGLSDALVEDNSIYLGNDPSSSTSTAEKNVAIGITSLDSITTGNNNCAVGYDSLTLLSTGSDNTALGYQAGDTITTSSNNTCIGSGADVTSSTDTNCTSVGKGALCTTSNQVTLGGAGVTTLRCVASTIATVSDGRDKTNIQDSTYGLDFINKLRPVRYTWNKRHLRDGDDTYPLNGKERLGFIAQELQGAMEPGENDVLDLVLEVDPERIEIKQGNLLPIMLKAIQELKAENNELKARVDALENN